MSQYGSTRETSGNPSRHDVLQRIVDTVEDQDPLIINERSLLLHPQKTSGCQIGIRHLIAFLGFLGFVNVYAMRVNLSVAIVAMVNSSAIPHVNTTSSNVCPASGMNNTDNSGDGEFVWTEAVQGTILGSFFWGYIFTNLVGGRLAEVWGACKVMGLGVLGTALLTLLSPVVARWNLTAFVALRVLEGMTEGVTYPAMSCLLARWIPPMERSQTIAIVYSGAMIGTVVSLPLSGLLCDSTFLGGWPAVFYVFGGLGVLWSVVWLLLSSDSPDKNRFISDAEKLYIGATLNSNADASSYKVLPVPWRHIMKSLPFYAILVAHTTQNWLFYTLLTEMPTYMKNILHFDIKKNSALSALPYFVMWMVCIASGFAADHLRRSGVLSTTNARKIFNSIGMFMPAACLIAASYSGCRELLTVVLLVLAVGTNGAVMAGYNSSHLDVAPNFAGTLMGLTNTVATIPGFLAPFMVGQLVSGNETLGQWRLVFFIASALIVCGNIFYIIFYDGETQPWNEPQRYDTGSPEPNYEASCNSTAIDASQVELQQ